MNRVRRNEHNVAGNRVNRRVAAGVHAHAFFNQNDFKVGVRVRTNPILKIGVRVGKDVV